MGLQRDTAESIKTWVEQIPGPLAPGELIPPSQVNIGGYARIRGSYATTTPGAMLNVILQYLMDTPAGCTLIHQIQVPPTPQPPPPASPLTVYAYDYDFIGDYCRYLVQVDPAGPSITSLACFNEALPGGTGLLPVVPPPQFTAQQFVALLSPLFTTTLEIGAALGPPVLFNCFYTPTGSETAASISDSLGNGPFNVLGSPNPILYPFALSQNGINNQVIITLTASDGVNNDTSSVTASFQPRVYFGVDASGALASEAQIEGLALNPFGANPLQPSRVGNYTYQAVNQFIYFSFPTVYGPAGPGDFNTFPVPTPGGFIQTGVVNITANTPGAPVNQYDIWRSLNPVTTVGTQTLVVT